MVLVLLKMLLTTMKIKKTKKLLIKVQKKTVKPIKIKLVTHKKRAIMKITFLLTMNLQIITKIKKKILKIIVHKLKTILLMNRTLLKIIILVKITLLSKQKIKRNHQEKIILIKML